ncbi:MAG: energy transducer TonB [Paracoccaceae bacterium]
MDTGTKISGIAHVGLIGAALFGGAFTSAPPPVEVQDVSVVTAEQFAALLEAQEPPETATEPEAPTPPQTEDETPGVTPPTPEPEVDLTAPEATDAPETEEVPETLPDPLPPQPETEAVDTAPSIEPPQELDTPLPPAATARPEPRPAERIAPQPVAAPPPDTRIDDAPTPDTSPDPGAQTPEEQEEATAQEEVTDRIAPETAESDSLAPAASIRPPSSRPRAPTRTAEPETDNTRDAVNAALEEALGGTDTPDPTPVPTGPPLTSGEKSDLILAVSNCWNVGSLSTEALNTTVIVGVKMTEDAKPIASSIRLISSFGGSEAAANQAFQAARRAILRCGARGYALPVEKYGQWRDIEMTFNPERMRIR